MGLKETELKRRVDSCRVTNPNFVQLWGDVDEVTITTVSPRQPVEHGKLKFTTVSGILFIQLPSGRRLAYVKS